MNDVASSPNNNTNFDKRSLAEAQAYFKGLVPPGVSVVDELLAERREEATRELLENGGVWQ